MICLANQEGVASSPALAFGASVAVKIENTPTLRKPYSTWMKGEHQAKPNEIPDSR